MVLLHNLMLVGKEKYMDELGAIQLVQLSVQPRVRLTEAHSNCL